MKFPSKLFIVPLVFFVTACSIAKEHKVNDTFRPVSGTKTVVVGLPLDKNGAPDKKIADFKIIMNPGQKIVFAGPEKFSVFFKNRKSPTDLIKNNSRDGVVTIRIPRDLLDKPIYQDELKKNGFVEFNYGVDVEGKEIDPKIIIVRE